MTFLAEGGRYLGSPKWGSRLSLKPKENVKMVEVCFDVMSLDGATRLETSEGRLTEKIYSWFTSRVIYRTNTQQSVLISKHQIEMLSENVWIWIEINMSRRVLKDEEAQQLNKMLLVLEELDRVPDKYSIRFRAVNAGEAE